MQWFRLSSASENLNCWFYR